MTAEDPNTFRGLLEYQEPLYRDLINHTAIVPSLHEILTSPDASPWSNKFYLSHEYGLVFQAGDRGPWFHGGGTPYEPWTGYTVRDGRIFCGLVAVIWVLTDVREGDGGFWYIPGSHKASFPLPHQIQTYEIVPRCVVQPAVKAGSAILFTESLPHGTRPWTAPHERIALFYKYVPGHIPLSSPRPQPLLERMTADQKNYLVTTPDFG